MKDNNGKEQYRLFSETKTLDELEQQRYNAMDMMMRALIEGQPEEMLDKYRNAWNLASDTYHARKWSEQPQSIRDKVPELGDKLQ